MDGNYSITTRISGHDPSDHARILNPEDRFKDYGIRMVYSIAREVNYQNLLDQNVLTIRL